METFNQLRKNLKSKTTDFKVIKLALLSDNSDAFIAEAIKASGIKNKLLIDIYNSNFDQIDMNILVEESKLYEFKPDFVYINFSTQKILEKFYQSSLKDRNKFNKVFILHLNNLINRVFNKTNSKIFINNFNEIDDKVFGNLSNKTTNSFLYQLRKINFLLMETAQKKTDLFIIDFLSLQIQLGNKNVISRRLYLNTSMSYKIDFIPYISKAIVDVILSNIGYFNKCLILDLDNTLWGGVIGDDGLSNIELGETAIGRSYSEFQRWILELKNRGIILCVCSKNDIENAIKPFKNHPNMLIKKSDISIFIANWDEKTKNIKKIKSLLNIDYNSIVFIDDNPLERDLAKLKIPSLTVPNLPKDPAEYLPYLKSLNLFETNTFDEDDKNRNQYYIEEIKRDELKINFKTQNEYLKHLKMESSLINLKQSNINRVYQLLMRTNQFNMTDRRYSIKDLNTFINKKNLYNINFDLKDRYGNYGIVSSVFLKRVKNIFYIENWIMSCRVFNRQFETFIIKQIIFLTSKEGGRKIIGNYIETKKNRLIKNLYKKMKFNPIKSKWELEIKNKLIFDSQIKLKEIDEIF